METTKMNCRSLELPEIREINPVIHRDSRGFFSEVFNENALRELGINIVWMQDNHSFSSEKGVLRGLHFQIPPLDQDKLVRVIRGSILDVVVDIRNGSPSFGEYVSLVVSREKWNQILVPKGFAHGFVTLEPDTEVIYKVSAPYSKEHDRVISFDDPDLAIDWKFEKHELSLSKKDAAALRLRDQDTGFDYELKEQLV